MKLLIISANFPPEKFGNASRIFDMSKYLVQSGVDLTILAPHPSYPPGSFSRKWNISESNTIEGIKVINLLAWQPKSPNPSFLSRIAYYISFPIHTLFWVLFNRKKFDIIMTSAPPIFTGFGGLFSKLLLRKQWMLDIRDLWIDVSILSGYLKEGSFFERVSRKYERFCCSKADRIFVTSKGTGTRIIDIYNVNGDKIKLIPNGVDTEFFYPIQVEKKNQIIFAGNIGHLQDVENAILSMKLINQQFDMKLLIVGDGDLKKQMEALTRENNLSEYVTFAGLVSRDKIPEMLAESLIGLALLKKSMSLEYAIPTKAYEAMACGIPFIATGIGEIRNLTIRSGAGLIAENTPESIADVILTLLNNPSKIKEMGTKGRVFVETNYSRKSIANKLKVNAESLYNSTIAERSNKEGVNIAKF